MTERRLGLCAKLISGVLLRLPQRLPEDHGSVFSCSKGRISQTPPALLKGQYALSSKLEDISTLLRVSAL